MLRSAVQDRIGKTLDLQLVSVSVFTQRPVVLAVLCGETLDMTGFMEPGQKHFTLHAAVLAINLEAFFEIPPDWDGKVKVPHRAAGIVRLDKPAVGAESLEQARLEGDDFTAEESRGINHVTG